MVDTTNLTRIEYTIVGTILMEPDHVGEVVAKLAPKNFNQLGSRGLFETISALHFEGAPIDPVVVIQRAGSDYEVVVNEALQHRTAPSSLPWYCEMLLAQSRLQQMQAEAMTIVGAETLQDAGESLDRMNSLMVTQNSVEILSASQAAMDFYDRQSSDKKPEYLTWGWTSSTRACMPSWVTSLWSADTPAPARRCCPSNLRWSWRPSTGSATSLWKRAQES